MRILCKWLCCLALLLPAACYAENCPWLNAATARGVLGGDVTMAVSRPDATSIACEFLRQNLLPTSSLHIVVGEHPTGATKCGLNPKKLVGVGNEAFVCMLQDASGAVTEQVVGRVRDRAFVIRWTLSAETARSSETTASTMQALAEAVAGSLF
jgi:hypothetical protein